VVLGHQRTSLSDLFPVSYHLFSKTHDHRFASARPACRQPQQGLTSIFCVFGLKSQICIRHSRRSRVVPGHQRNSLSDLIPVSYHLFSETHDHHFVPARPTNRATRFGPPFSVFSASGLNFCGEHSKGLFVVLGHQRTSQSDFVLVRYGCRSESRFSDFSSHCRFVPSRPYFCFV
jgi:hypothetical protein